MQITIRKKKAEAGIILALVLMFAAVLIVMQVSEPTITGAVTFDQEDCLVNTTVVLSATAVPPGNDTFVYNSTTIFTYGRGPALPVNTYYAGAGFDMYDGNCTAAVANGTFISAVGPVAIDKTVLCFRNTTSLDLLEVVNVTYGAIAPGPRTMTFNVTGNGSYCAPPECGSTVDRSITLTGNLTNSTGGSECSGSGIVIGADNLIINCGGYWLMGDDSGTTDYGIDNSGGYDNVTIMNCGIRDFWRGVYAVGAENNSITNNTVTSQGQNGIFIDTGSSGTNITDNVVSDNAGNGIVSTGASNNVTIANNIAIDHNAGGFNSGITIGSSADVVIENNLVYNNNRGISFSSSNRTFVQHNVATNNTDRGIYHSSTSWNNTIFNNTITETGTYGIYLLGFTNVPTYTNVSNNTVTGSGTYGIFVSNADNNTIYNNFFNNTVNVNETDTSTDNAWNITPTAGTNILGGSFIAGNFWSDNADTDDNRDGLGEVAYAIGGEGLGSDLVPLVPIAGIACGGPVEESITMGNDLENSTGGTICAATGLIINQSDIMLDCAGYHIAYGQTGSGYGINVTGASVTNVTIKNCNITKASASGANNVGVGIANSSDVTVFNVTINTNGTDDNHGVLALGASNNNISFSSVSVDGTGFSRNVGIYLWQNAINNYIESNIVNTHGVSNNYGIFSNYTSDNTTIIRNNVTANGSSAGNYAIRFDMSSNGTVAYNQIISDGSLFANSGVTIFTASNFTNVTGNNVTTASTSPSAHGVFLLFDPHYAVVEDNNFTIVAPESSGIFIWEGRNSRFVNNRVRLLGTDQSLFTSNLIVANSTNITVTNLTSVNTDMLLSFDPFHVQINETNITAAYTFGSPFAQANISTYLNVTNITPLGWVALNLSYDPADVAASEVTSESSMRLWKYDDSTSAWTNTGFFNSSFGINDPSNYVFANITSFSTFGIFGITPITTCGNITGAGAYTLVNDVSSTETCIRITTGNVSLDCENNEIVYGGGGTGNGIFAEDGSNVTVENCQITKNGTSGSTNYGIQFSNITSSTISNNTITTNGTSSNYGIYLNTDVNTTLIEDNTIRTNGTSNNNRGIRVHSNSNNNTIVDNTVLTDGGTTGNTQNYGIELTSVASYNNISFNNVSTDGGNSRNWGFHTSAAVNNTFYFNNVSTNGGGNNRGIESEGAGVGGNTFTFNTFRTNGTSFNNYGAQLESSSSDFTNISFNTFFLESKNNVIEGIRILSGVNNVTVMMNTLTLFTNATDAYGITLSNGDSNTVSYNTINANSSDGENIGMRLSSGSDDNIITGNVFTVYQNDSIGFRVDSSTGNVFTDNTVTLDNETSAEWVGLGTATDNTVNDLIMSRSGNTVSFIDTATTIQGLLASEASLLGNAPGKVSISKFFNITNNTATSNVYFNVSYTDGEVVSIENENLDLWKYDGGWVDTGFFAVSSVDTAANEVFANITSFSTYGVFGESIPVATSGGQGGSGTGGQRKFKAEPVVELIEELTPGKMYGRYDLPLGSQVRFSIDDVKREMDVSEYVNDDVMGFTVGDKEFRIAVGQFQEIQFTQGMVRFYLDNIIDTGLKTAVLRLIRPLPSQPLPVAEPAGPVIEVPLPVIEEVAVEEPAQIPTVTEPEPEQKVPMKIFNTFILLFFIALVVVVVYVLTRTHAQDKKHIKHMRKKRRK